MTSSFGWLALDPEQRRRMMEAVDQFWDETTISLERHGTSGVWNS